MSTKLGNLQNLYSVFKIMLYDLKLFKTEKNVCFCTVGDKTKNQHPPIHT